MERIGPDKPRFYLKKAAILTETESTWIHELIRKDYFQPTQPAEGRGKPNLFSFNDLVKLEVLKVLGKLNLLKTAAVAVVKDTDMNKTGRYYSMGPPDGNHTTPPKSKTSVSARLRMSSLTSSWKGWLQKTAPPRAKLSARRTRKKSLRSVSCNAPVPATKTISPTARLFAAWPR